MKRATIEWLCAINRRQAVTSDEPIRDILDSDKRLRKQVADLKARLKDREDRLRAMTPRSDASRRWRDVLNLKLKSWRKGGK